MTHGNRRYVPVHLLYFLLLSVALYFAYNFLEYWFGNFYRGSREQYQIWYPGFYFIIFPVVKALPFLLIAVLIFFSRNILRSVINFIIDVFKNIFMLAKYGALRFFSSKKSKAAGESGLFIQSFKKSYKRYAMNVLLMLVSSFIMLVIFEVALRSAGLKPGRKTYSQYFFPTDTLKEISGFYADSNGIQVIAEEAREFICNELKNKKSTNELTPYNKFQSNEVYSLANDYIQLRHSNYRNTFKTFLEKIDTSVVAPDLAAAIREYAVCPINDDGFRSISFKKYNTKSKSILLLGDSFTWGHSTSNKTNSFSDLLLSKGYVVYNSGITGTDPAQYLQIAKTYVPKLQPDYVVVNFYLGNDIKYFERKPQPYLPVFYSTNAGNLISCPEGIYFDNPQAAYDHTLAVFSIPADNNAFNKFCSKTVIGTLIWRFLARLQFVNPGSEKYTEYYDAIGALTTEKPFSDVELRNIRDITAAHGGKFLLLAIPMWDGSKFIMPDDHPDIFENLEFLIPPVDKKHYKMHVDGHLNDEGNAVYAAFIDSLIQTGK